MFKTTMLAAGILFTGAILAWAEDAKKDAAKMIGTWNVVAEEKDGKEQAAEGIKGRQVRITRDTISCFDKERKSEMVAKYELDTTKKPWRVEFTGTEGEHKGKKFLGIAELQDDTLRICFAKPDKDAPSGFKSMEDQCCCTLKRAE